MTLTDQAGPPRRLRLVCDRIDFVSEQKPRCSCLRSFRHSVDIDAGSPRFSFAPTACPVETVFDFADQ